MPSRSVSQQRLFGMALAARRGDLKHPKGDVKKLANSDITTKDLKAFAKTKHEGLPYKIEKESLVSLSDYLKESLNL